MSINGFVPGLTLSRRFFDDAVQPILARSFPRLQYAAALIGPGSEVLGFDTPISTDHHWGPRVMLFLSEEDFNALGKEIDARLCDELPHTFLGYPTNFGPPDEIGVRLLQPIDAGPVGHRVELTTVSRWFMDYLGWDALGEPTIVEWLTFPQHRLRAATTGAVFQDDHGALTAARTALAWYPHDLWLYLLAAQWQRISEEEAFMARCGDVGDELGSTLVAARLVRDLMHLCFLMGRQYAPYAKWFGSGFRQLSIGNELEPVLLNAVRSSTWHERQRWLSLGYEHIATLHNSTGITDPLEPGVRNYYRRPYATLRAERFAAAIEEQIENDEVRRLPSHVGSLNQLIDATDKLESAGARARLGRVYIQRNSDGWQLACDGLAANRVGTRPAFVAISRNLAYRRSSDLGEWFSRVAARSAYYMGHYWAFTLAVLACIIWAASGPFFGYSDTWQLVINTATTVLTFLAVFLIQNSQNRESRAVQLKLDELIRVMDRASNRLIDIEEATDDDMERLANVYRRLGGAANYDVRSSDRPTKTGDNQSVADAG